MPFPSPLRCGASAALGLALALAFAAAPTTAATTSTPAGVLQDCGTHHGALSRPYRRETLRAAYEALAPTERLGGCGQGIASQLALASARGSADDVFPDCLGHGGRLTKRYTPAALRRAVDGLTREARSETRCLIGLYSQLRGLGRRPALDFPRRTVPRSELDHASGVAVTQALTASFAAFQRPRTGDDALSTSAASFAAFANATDGSDLAVDQSRRLGGTGASQWLTGGRGKVCVIRDFGRGTTAISCDIAARVLAGLPVINLSPAPLGRGFEVWGAVPDRTAQVQAVLSPRRTRAIPVAGNGIFARFARLPAALRWQTPDGREHYFDTSVIPCDPASGRCVAVPDPTRLGRHA